MQGPSSFPASGFPQIDLWMDNWAWAPCYPDKEPLPPDESRQPPAGLYRLGELVCALKMACDHLLQESAALKVRLSSLEQQVSVLQGLKAGGPEDGGSRVDESYEQ